MTHTPTVPLDAPSQLPLPPAHWHRHTTVVVVGSGAAGLSAALHLGAAGIDTAVLTRAGVTTSATDWAQGGLAAVWDPGDTIESHVADTLRAGAGACDEPAVRILVREAPLAIERLIDLGARFDRDASGAHDLHLEGGHSARRILHAGGDRSGHEVQATLARALHAMTRRSPGPHAHSPGLHLHDHTRVVDVLTDAHGHACGVRVVDSRGRVGEWHAEAVVLAAGGSGQAWSLTSNPAVATGDGLAMARRAGAAVRDVEFMQFHPTVLHRAPGAPLVGDRDVLVSEAVRGEGAVLRGPHGEPVMQGVHPLADLAPRDVVAATMFAHMQATGASHLDLDARHLGRTGWQEKFPAIWSMLTARGIDPARVPIPVRPGAHYHCGGVAADMDGRTTVAGLYAIGEVAGTGVHGANRLASNSVTEALVGGDRCGALLADLLGGTHAPHAIRVPRERPAQAWIDPACRVALQQAMDHGVGVLRTDEGLAGALAVLAGLPRIGADTPSGESGDSADHVHDLLDVTSMATVGTLVATAARARTESRGCHRRADYPHPHDIRSHHAQDRTAPPPIERTPHHAVPAVA